MKPPVFIGDEHWATGFRLAGVTAWPVAPGREEEAFAHACAEAGVVLVDARCAQRLPADVLAAALEAGRPPVLVLPERPGMPPPGDPAAAVRRLLGLGS
ncbi:V-type ATP synthase subunit F [Aromatoleum toluclasticum]|uniref:V-type ATP synthase subunit F n=1 Tax=Aromatoleum toluclasticum TaxID=92003 RepID=UPI001D18B3E6|nr:V-type ATP synthase subunit F [Aromatoleum toluclasticum]MCC4115962.1 V-type ATP synthase subunit F [Aromatoleum toluclasticum]